MVGASRSSCLYKINMKKIEEPCYLTLCWYFPCQQQWACMVAAEQDFLFHEGSASFFSVFFQDFDPLKKHAKDWPKKYTKMCICHLPHDSSTYAKCQRSKWSKMSKVWSKKIDLYRPPWREPIGSGYFRPLVVEGILLSTTDGFSQTCFRFQSPSTVVNPSALVVPMQILLRFVLSHCQQADTQS